VKQTRGPVIEVDSVEEFDRRIAAGATSTNGWHLRSLDLTQRGDALRSLDMSVACDSGIVFLPGVGGTVRRSSRDACENYYADESSVAPMVLAGVEHWTTTVPAWPLLKALSGGRPMEPHVHQVDTVDEAAALIAATPRP
jgi:hypothetical protein